jgi:4-amino-4-deoxy-L-arabinose transferase-like glycosyltransferase
MASTVLGHSGRGDCRALVGITTVVLMTALLASAPLEIPILDDWTYAWSVEHFLETGELRMLEWSAHYPLAQILWGALFSRLLGFSFAVLRLSTLVLAWAGVLTLYGTLRELGTRPLLAGLGALLLWCNPVFFVLSHSFMTDVPFVSLMSAALFGYVRWVKRRRTWDLSLGSVAALLACLIRQPGAALALIPLASLLLARTAGGERQALPWSQGVWLLVPFLGVGLTVWWIHGVHGETRVALEKARMLRLIFAIDRWVWVYVRELLHALMHLGLVLWPLAWMAFGQLSTRALAGAFAVVAVLSGLILWQEGALPNPLGVMLTWDALGHARVLIAGEIVHRQLPRWGQTVMLGVSLSGAVGLVAVLWDRLRRWPHGSREPYTLLLLNLLLQSLLFEALWLYYDRYYLPLLPGLIALLLARLRPTKVAIMGGLAGVLLGGAIAVTGTIDQWRYHRTVVEARDWLLRHGVGAEHIDAGYALTGWWLYAHAASGPPSRGREPDVPWITGWRPLPYKVANAAEPSYTVVRSFRRPMLWAASDTLYVLEHTAVTDDWGLPSLMAREPWNP